MSKNQNNNIISFQKIRDDLIERIDCAGNATYAEEKMADALFESGLTVYSKKYSIPSIFYCSFAQSFLNSSVSLHPEQLRVIKTIKNNAASIISAPTSFGKTFCIFEYIARYHPKNVVLVVPTLALEKEYILEIVQKHNNKFNYKVYSSIEDTIEYDFINNDNLFVLTHEKVVANSNIEKLKQIDFLVIDEVYKLDKSISDDRTLVLNVAYYQLSKIAEKYVLLAPFIKGVKNIDELEKKPIFCFSDYSPVINKINLIEVAKEKDRFQICHDLLINKLQEKKTLVYLPGPNCIDNFVQTTLSNDQERNFCSDEIQEFIDWASSEIHPDWDVVLAIKRGYLMHHGSLPSGIRDYLLSLFNDVNSKYDTLLCTNTLLEGVNTQAEYLIVVKPNKKSMRKNFGSPFSAFDFYNLVGRTGRLNKYFIGYTYYLKGPDDDLYDDKAKASLEILFELSEKTQDIDIQINDSKNNPEVINYLSNLNISLEEYQKNIGSPIRFDSFKKIHDNYIKKRDELLINIDDSWRLTSIISEISIVNKSDRVHPGILNAVISGRHRSIRKIVDNLISQDYYKEKFTVSEIISNITRIKNSYLEHNLLIKTKVIELFMEKDGMNQEIIDKIKRTINNPIEQMYYTNSPSKKMLKSIGIYDSDIDLILSYIGDNFNNINELKMRIQQNKNKFFRSICFISKFEINCLLKEND